MKKLLIICLLTSAQVSIFASPIDTLDTDSNITEAIVYYKGVTIHREAVLSNIGEYVVAIKGLPLRIDRKSITVEADEQLEIKSVKSSFSSPTISLTDTQLDFEKKNAILVDSIELLKILIEVLDAEYAMIKTNNNFENDEEITSVEEVILASDFYQSRVKALSIERLHLKRDLDKLRFRKQTNEYENQKYYQRLLDKELTIYVHVKSKRMGTRLKINYYHPLANWSPYYDLKAGRDKQNLKLHRKAYVTQSTEENWENIKLTLSTSIPTNDNRLPVLNPVRLHHHTPRNITSYDHIINDPSYSGRVVDSAGLPLIGVSVIISETDQGTITDIDGQFYLPAAIGKNVIISYTGYSTVACRLNNQYNVITLKEGALLDEVIVTGYGGQKKKKEKVAPVRKQINLEITETLNTLSYNLTEKYSLDSESEPIDVLLRIEDLPTTLKYESIPIKNESAYLIAEIKDWHLYNLERAPVNLFIDGTFKGKTTIDPDSQDDKLKISLGNDPEVSMNRKWINNKYKKKLLSRHKEEVHHFVITIKNNKAVPISINVQDQLPISSDEAIEIEPKNLSGGSLEEESGFIYWNLELKSGESKELELVYKLKYPKHYDLNI